LASVGLQLPDLNAEVLGLGFQQLEERGKNERGKEGKRERGKEGKRMRLNSEE